MNIGIIGYGDFGRILTTHLSPHVRVIVSSRRKLDLPPGTTQATTQQIATCDYLLLCVPLSAYPSVLAEVAPHISSHTTIVDVCSVKLRPLELLKEYAPDAKRLLTHPLFGPQSASDSLSGHDLILCPEPSTPVDDPFIALLGSLGIKISSMTPDAHDQLMAKIHALTFFVGRSLTTCGISDLPLVTPSYRKLLAIADLDRSQTDDLFLTVECGNPYAQQARLQFLTAAENLNKQLSTADDPWA